VTQENTVFISFILADDDTGANSGGRIADNNKADETQMATGVDIYTSQIK